MEKRTVLFDRIRFKTGYSKTELRPDPTASADKGETVDLLEEEAERLDALGATGTPTDLAELQRAEALRLNPPTPAEQISQLDSPPGSTAASGMPDDELSQLSLDNLAAHLQQNPGDLERIESLEGAKNSPRKGVTELLERIRQARAELT